MLFKVRIRSLISGPNQRQLEEMRKVFDKKEKREDGMREEIDATKLMNNNPLD